MKREKKSIHSKNKEVGVFHCSTWHIGGIHLLLIVHIEVVQNKIHTLQEENNYFHKKFNSYYLITNFFFKKNINNFLTL